MIYHDDISSAKIARAAWQWGEQWPRIGLGLALIGVAVMSLAYFGRSVELGRHDVPSPAVYRDETPTSF